jgi:hypothetical protein
MKLFVVAKEVVHFILFFHILQPSSRRLIYTFSSGYDFHFISCVREMQ